MKQTFHKKRILLMVGQFYHYGAEIAKELERQGAQVQLIYNRWEKESFRFSMNWLVTLIHRVRNPFFKRRFTNQVLKQVEGRPYDYLLAVGGFSAQRRLIKRLKAANPLISTRIFFWDSFAYWNIQHLRKWFDVAFSFDPIDCARYPDLRYLPDFYLGQQKNTDNYLYEVSHIGSSHLFVLDRMVVLDALKKQLDDQGTPHFLMVYEPNDPDSLKMRLSAATDCRWARYRSLLKRYGHNPIIHKTPMPYDQVVEIESGSRCVVDLPPAKQAGTTIRALEAIAAGKKVVTTNKQIVHEAFFHPDNIAVLDPANPCIPKGFLQTPIQQTDISYLRFDNWLKTLLR